MMIVDLVDEVDFKEKLLAISAPIGMDDSLEEVSVKLKGWLESDPDQLEELKSVYEAFEASGATILPEVQAVLLTLLSL